MMRLSSASQHLHTLREGEALPSLDAALKETCREHVRRVDRFIKLALIGSARCAADRSLRQDCALYLGSGFGPIGSNIATQEQMFRDHETPSPYHFVNTLGSSAGFHVAKNLGLDGQNLFISRRGDSFMASQALVGVVEEVNLPLKDHRRRRGLPPEALVAEASHWLLLEAGGGEGRPLELRYFSEIAALESALLSSAGSADRVHLASGLEGEGVDRLRRQFPQDAGSAGHGNLEAAWFCGLAVDGGPGGLSLADGGPGRGFSLLHLGA
jgi:hypothetical protein